MSDNAGDKPSVAETLATETPPKPKGAGVGFLIFFLGFFCGVPLAIFAPELITEYGGLILAAVVLVMLTIVAVLAIVFVLRQRIWHWLFRRGEIELTRFAGPLSEVARHAAERRVDAATEAARNFAELALARYAWVSTRRWLVASITGLIASIAALAGSALLFEQNRLLREQSGLLREQNERIAAQSELLDTQTQLVEAERSAQVGPEVVEIGALIGAERQGFLDAGNSIEEFTLADLSSAIRSRIVAASLVARPYRYLQARESNPLDSNALAMKALSTRPDTVSDPSRLSGYADQAQTVLIDRPLSPERGDLLSMLVSNRVYDTELLSFDGADFTFAELRREVLPGVSLRHARLSFADFSWTRIVSCQFGAAALEHARMENSVIRQTSFSGLRASEVEFPFEPGDLQVTPTALTGASFRNSVLFEDGFRDINAIVPRFDNAVVAMSDFTDAQINGAVFANAMIIDSEFAGAGLRSLDLEGAIVFDQTFIRRLADGAEPGTFVPERWRLDPISAGEVAEHPGYIEMTNHVPESAYVGRQAFRVARVRE